jgi:hypothetical protein
VTPRNGRKSPTPPRRTRYCLGAGLSDLPRFFLCHTHTFPINPGPVRFTPPWGSEWAAHPREDRLDPTPPRGEGELIFDLFEAWKQSAREISAMKAYGARQWFTAAAESLARGVQGQCAEKDFVRGIFGVGSAIRRRKLVSQYIIHCGRRTKELQRPKITSL